jgi:hypothetical protein
LQVAQAEHAYHHLQDPLQSTHDSMLDVDQSEEDAAKIAQGFGPVSHIESAGGKQFRRLMVPPHRFVMFVVSKQTK